MISHLYIGFMTLNKNLSLEIYIGMMNSDISREDFIIKINEIINKINRIKSGKHPEMQYPWMLSKC